MGRYALIEALWEIWHFRFGTGLAAGQAPVTILQSELLLWGALTLLSGAIGEATDRSRSLIAAVALHFWVDAVFQAPSVLGVGPLRTYIVAGSSAGRVGWLLWTWGGIGRAQIGASGVPAATRPDPNTLPGEPSQPRRRRLTTPCEHQSPCFTLRMDSSFGYCRRRRLCSPSPVTGRPHPLRSSPRRRRLHAWPTGLTTGGDAGGSRFSPLTEINRENVQKLRVAWTYNTGDVSDGTKHPRKSAFEATPILVDGTLYFSTAFNRVIALDPETGAQRWSYDPKIDLDGEYSEGLINRGVSSWADSKAASGYKRRIFIATIDARLICLDAAAGTPCGDFGAAGEIHLRQGIPNIIRDGEYEETSPPAIIDDLVIVGSSVADNDRVEMPSGVVRAFDARTGALRWSWNPIPQDPRDPAARTWKPGSRAKTGAANAWSVIGTDPGRHLVFVPTGSASPDYYGGERKGDDKWANSVVALRSGTGELAWGFQLVHHDLWDYDTASPPLLTTLVRHGTAMLVVIQGNKTGRLFVLNRNDGTPVFPVEERPVPQSRVPGEETAPTQPFPLAPPPLSPQRISMEEAWGLTPADRQACRERMEKLQYEGIFTPPTVSGSLVYPGNIGGMNWSGYAFHPDAQILLTNTLRVAFEVHLIPRNDYPWIERAAKAGLMRAEVSPQHGTPYGMSREAILSPSQLPCVGPPWGVLTAVDLGAGKIRWEAPLGATAGSLALDPPARYGLAGFGGPIVTAGGLVFIGAAWDGHLRAFDIETGKELWSGQLPAPGEATPMTYRVRPNGRQFVVIAAGGHGKLPIRLGDSLVAFTLP